MTRQDTAAVLRLVAGHTVWKPRQWLHADRRLAPPMSWGMGVWKPPCRLYSRFRSV